MQTKAANGKLVRDLIPDLIRASGREPAVTVLDDAAYAVALRAKLEEEAREVAEAESRTAILEELADVYEVLLALARSVAFDLRDVEEAARLKAEQRGAFHGRLYLIAE